MNRLGLEDLRKTTQVIDPHVALALSSGNLAHSPCLMRNSVTHPTRDSLEIRRDGLKKDREGLSAEGVFTSFDACMQKTIFQIEPELSVPQGRDIPWSYGGLER
jgi:hypothetical protein